MRSVKLLQLGVNNRLMQLIVMEFGDGTTFYTNHVMVGQVLICSLVLGRIPELMLDDQISFDKQIYGIVKGSSTDAETAMLPHIGKKTLDVEMSANGIDSIQYCITLGSFPLSVRLQILSQYLFNLFLYVLFHIVSVQLSKLTLFIYI